MPQVPYSGLPSSTPSTQPAPLVNVNPAPQAFGAGVAASIAGDLGKAAGDVSKSLDAQAVQFQMITNKTNSDEASASYTQDVDGAMADFRQLKQKNAVNAFPQMVAKLQALRTEKRATLDNPEAQVMFDAESRRVFTNMNSEAKNHVAAEHVAWTKGVNQNVIESGQGLIVSATDEAGFQLGADKVRSGVINIMAQDGIPPDSEEGQQMLAKAQADSVALRIKTLGESEHPLEAKAFADAHDKELAGHPATAFGVHQYLKNKIEPLEVASTADDFADHALGQASHELALGRSGPLKSPPIEDIQAAPAAKLSEILGAPISIVSGARDHPVLDKATGRVANHSDHMDNRGWDVSSPGMTGEQLKDKWVASGYNANQLIVHDNSLHIGLGVAMKGEIRGVAPGAYPLLGRLAGSGPTTQSYAAPVTADDIYRRLPDIEKSAQETARQRWPENQVLQDTFTGKVYAKIERQASILRQNELGAKDTLVAALQPDGQGNLPRSWADYIKGPGVIEALGHVSSHTVESLQKQITRNNNPSWSEITPDIQATIDRYTTMAQDPNQRRDFMQADLVNEIMPPTLRNKFQQLQAKYRTAGDQPVNVNQAFQVSAEVFKQNNIGKTSPDYPIVQQRLQQSISAFRGVSGKDPDQETIKRMSQDILRNYGLHKIEDDAVIPGVPDTEVKTIMDHFHRRGAYKVSEDMIKSAYAQKKAYLASKGTK